MSWTAFFVCFFSWFSVASLMPVIRVELHMTQARVANTVVASVFTAIVARLLIGWLRDRVGPRRANTGLLLLGALLHRPASLLRGLFALLPAVRLR